MAYLGELRTNWRYLAAACVGLASGFGLNQYVAGTFAPHLIREFGWSKSQFALTGLTIIISMISLPIAGRLTDRLGVRRMASFGVALVPLFYLAYSQMSGAFSHFFIINILQTALVASTTTSTVYSRLIAEQFDRARGLGLSLAACSPAAAAAAVMPLLSGFIDDHGWRAGYMLLGAVTAVTGAVMLLLIPRRLAGGTGAHAHLAHAFDYRGFFRNPIFRIIAAAVLLSNLTHMIMASQLKLVLLDQGRSAETASYMLSLFAIGIMLGRLACGLALDKFPSHIVAAVALGLPGIGILMLVSGVEAELLLGCAVLLIGLSTGAEFDVIGYLAMRFFRVEIYSTVYSLIAIMVALSSAIGSAILSLTLKLTNSFIPFLTGGATATLVGSSLFLLLGRYPPVEPARRAPDNLGEEEI